jgi:hypothetical protein
LELLVVFTVPVMGRAFAYGAVLPIKK